MALVNTGLGWSAEGSYLRDNSGAIGTIKRMVMDGAPNQPIPHFDHEPTADEVFSGGCVVGYNTAYPTLRYFIASFDVNEGGASSKQDVFAAFWDGFSLPCFASVDDGSFNIAIIVQDTTLGTYQILSRYYLGPGYYNPTAEVYSTRITSGPNMDYLPEIPVFNTYADALAAIHVSDVEFSKVNSGYGVVCFTKWLTSNETELVSPIIISSNREYIEMSATVTGLYSATANKLVSGINFYMNFYQNAPTGDVTSSYPILDLTDLGGIDLDTLFSAIISRNYANVTITDSVDPYNQDGEGSQEGGGDGEGDDADDVDFTDPPSTSIGATGLLTIFCPSLYELQQLGQFMWSSFDVDNWRKIIANPMDAILGLHIIPVPAIITGTKSLKVAGIDTTYSMSYTTVRYIRRPMGTCDVPKKWGAYLDYNPYTKLSIFLPYIGFKELDADDVMGKTISLQYIVDILTGACVAELKCGDTVLYSWSGNCANEVPISASDWRGAIASAIGIAGTIAATAAVTGGATAPMAASMIASVGANSMNLKPTINRSGAISGSAGFIGGQRPYIIRTIPNLVIPTDQNKFIGYPSFVTVSLGSLTGYNEISSIHLEGIPATGAELEELESILKGGAIF